MATGAHNMGPGDVADVRSADPVKDPLGQLKEAAGELEERHGALRRLLDEAMQTQQKIERSRRAWLSAFDAVPEPIFMHDREFRIVRANRAYAERAGLDFPELLGRPYWEIFPKSPAPLPACAAAVTATGTDEVDDEIRLDTGELLLSRAFPVRDAQGAYLYSIHILEDITRKRRAESTRYVLSEALRQAAEGIVLLDLDLRVRYANHALRQMLAREAGELTGKPLAGFAVGKTFRPDSVRRSLVEEGHWTGDVLLRDANGVSIPAGLTLARVADRNREVVAYVGTLTDLRPLRQAEQSLRESEARYHQLFEQLGEAACYVDAASGRMIDINRQAEKLFGRSREELFGMCLSDLHPADKAEHYRRLYAEQMGPVRAIEIEADIVRKDGKVVTAGASVIPIAAAGKQVVLVLFHETTGHRPVVETPRQAPAPAVAEDPPPPAAVEPATPAPSPPCMPNAGITAIALLMNDDTVAGTLRTIDFKRAYATVVPAGGEPRRIPFAMLRSLALPNPLPAPAAPAARAFRVLYTDGRELTGTAQAAVSDRHGLHLQLGRPDGKLHRSFIPAQVIKELFLPPPIGEALREAGSVTTVDIETALDKQTDLRAKRIGEYLQTAAARTVEELHQALTRRDMSPARRIGESLLAEGLISSPQLETALKTQRTDRHKRLGDILVEMHATTPDALHAVLARTLGIPFVHLHEFEIDKNVLPLVGVELVRKHTAIPLMLHDNRLVVAMEDPVNLETINLLRFITGLEVEVTAATREDVLWAIGKYYEASDKQDETDSLESLEHDESVSVAASEEQAFADAERLGQERPVVRLVNNIILEGIRRRASDIHLHPFRDHADLLYRIDGTLVKVRSFNIKLLPALAARIKIIARLDIAERRLPQDGAARALYEDRTIDLRISIIPTVDGESVVIRILNTEAGLKILSQLGFSSHDEMQFADLLHKSYGILLVTGPTGSGKSTTLYAALGEVIKQNVNIITVEDPVEYHIPGIEQIQVNTATGYTFAKALRHILRHDPDAILIGEIRDEETAKIAIQSALTGHLVLSTLHTNDAASSVTRLLEMGVEPYLLSATLLGVLAQRLVRRNCPQCLEVEQADPLIRRVMSVAEDEVFYKGRGCEHCNNTGYSGRMAVYELLLVNDALRARIVPAVSAEELRALATKQGTVSLTQNALAQARARKTSLIEVYRVRLE